MDIQPFLVSRLKSRLAAKVSVKDRNAELEKRVAVLEAAFAMNAAVTNSKVGRLGHLALAKRGLFPSARQTCADDSAIRSHKELAERRRSHLKETVSTDDMLAEIAESYE